MSKPVKVPPMGPWFYGEDLRGPWAPGIVRHLTFGRELAGKAIPAPWDTRHLQFAQHTQQRCAPFPRPFPWFFPRDVENLHGFTVFKAQTS